MEKGIKAVIFDVNGVLLLGQGVSFHKYIARKLHTDLETWFDAIEQYWSLFVEGKVSEEKFLNHLSQVFNKSPKKIRLTISKAFEKRFKKNSWLFKQVFILKQQGYKTAILSDQVPIGYELFEKKFHLSSLVDVSIWSNKVKLRKPNLEVYRLCLEKLNVLPKEALFIDNRSWNLIPAEEIGMRTILFENNSKLKKNKVYKNLI